MSRNTVSPSREPPRGRIEYLDRLRGVAVLIMIEAHVFDAWTRAADRAEPAYRWAITIGGFGAPLFLFLAGVAVALAASSGRGLPDRAAAGRILRRGAEILALAYVFRLQSWLVSGGAFPRALLKVDILNIMGVSMMVAAGLWCVSARPRTRTLVMVVMAAALVGLTPAVYESVSLDTLSDHLESYVRPDPGRTSFAVFPWTAFLLAGVAVGLGLERERSRGHHRRILGWFGGTGTGLALASFLWSLAATYDTAGSWTSSPTFFLLRLGILVASVPLAAGWTAASPGPSPLRIFGVSSLFVYWIHVEMVYGVPSLALHRNLSFGEALAGYFVLTSLLLALVCLKNWILRIRSVAATIRHSHERA